MIYYQSVSVFNLILISSRSAVIISKNLRKNKLQKSNMKILNEYTLSIIFIIVEIEFQRKSNESKYQRIDKTKFNINQQKIN
jgi:hypothetical protein